MMPDAFAATLYHDGNAAAVPVSEWFDAIRQIGVAAVVFDCDGTLAESSEAHFRSMQLAAAQQGREMSRDWYAARTGLDRSALFEEFASLVGDDFDRHRAALDSIAAFPRNTGLIKPIPETVALFDRLHAAGYPLAVGTNAERGIAQVSLNRAGVLSRLSVLVSISDGVRPKPSPDIFQLAAERLSVAHDRTLVIEDSPQGLSAAIAAGMPALKVTRLDYAD